MGILRMNKNKLKNIVKEEFFNTLKEFDLLKHFKKDKLHPDDDKVIDSAAMLMQMIQRSPSLSKVFTKTPLGKILFNSQSMIKESTYLDFKKDIIKAYKDKLLSIDDINSSVSQVINSDLNFKKSFMKMIPADVASVMKDSPKPIDFSSSKTKPDPIDLPNLKTSPDPVDLPPLDTKSAINQSEDVAVEVLGYLQGQVDQLYLDLSKRLTDDPQQMSKLEIVKNSLTKAIENIIASLDSSDELFVDKTFPQSQAAKITNENIVNESKKTINNVLLSTKNFIIKEYLNKK